MTAIAKLLSLAGVEGEWASALEREGVHYHADVMHLSSGWLTCLGLTFTEAHNLITTAWSAHAAGGVDCYVEILAAASIRQAEAKASLERIVEQLDGPVRECVEEARRLLENPDPRSACLALTCATRAQTRCQEGDEEARSLCNASRMDIRDVLVWRVQLNCPWGDRDAFVAALQQAYGRPVDKCSMSRILHSHNKLIGGSFPSSFLSKCKCESEARGYTKRPAKKKRAAMEVDENP